jgi:hypothetical protein
MTDQKAGTDLVFARATLQDRVRWANEIANAGDLVPRGFRDGNRANPAKVLLAAETGAMLGIHPIAALQGIHVIEGKPTISAGLMSALVRRAGHKLRVTTRGSVKDGTFEAIAELIRFDDPDFVYRSVWNAERANRAGLDKKDVWTKYFESMCKSRAISEVTKEGAEDVLMGGVYTPEEFDVPVDEHGEVIEDAEIVPEVIVEELTDRWRNLIVDATTLDELASLWDTGKNDRVLGLPIDGRPLGDHLREKKARLLELQAQEEAETPAEEPVIALATGDTAEPVYEDEVPF